MSLTKLLFSWSNPFSDFRYLEDPFTVRRRVSANENDLWIVDHDYRIECTRGNTTTKLVVPKGTPTNLASVPWFGRILVPVSGKHTEASIVHDFCYAGKALSRFESDGCF